MSMPSICLVLLLVALAGGADDRHQVAGVAQRWTLPAIRAGRTGSAGSLPGSGRGGTRTPLLDRGDARRGLRSERKQRDRAPRRSPAANRRLRTSAAGCCVVKRYSPPLDQAAVHAFQVRAPRSSGGRWSMKSPLQAMSTRRLGHRDAHAVAEHEPQVARRTHVLQRAGRRRRSHTRARRSSRRAARGAQSAAPISMNTVRGVKRASSMAYGSSGFFAEPNGRGDPEGSSVYQHSPSYTPAMVRESDTRTKSMIVWPSPMRLGTSANSGAPLPITMVWACAEHLVDGRHHQAREVRDLVQDVVAVRAVDGRRGSRCGRRRCTS